MLTSEFELPDGRTVQVSEVRVPNFADGGIWKATVAGGFEFTIRTSGRDVAGRFGQEITEKDRFAMMAMVGERVAARMVAPPGAAPGETYKLILTIPLA